METVENRVLDLIVSCFRWVTVTRAVLGPIDLSVVYFSNSVICRLSDSLQLPSLGGSTQGLELTPLMPKSSAKDSVITLDYVSISTSDTKIPPFNNVPDT